jgi:hypothetical protein
MFAVGAFVHWQASFVWDDYITVGLPPLLDEIIIFGFYGLAAMVLLYPVLLGWCFLAAPYRVYRSVVPRDERAMRPNLVIEFDNKKDISKRHEGKIWWVSVRVLNHGDVAAEKVTLQIVSIEAVGKNKVRRQAVVDKIKQAWVICIPYEQLIRYRGRKPPVDFPLAPGDNRSVCVAEISQSSFALQTTVGEWDGDIWRPKQWISPGHFLIRLKAYADEKYFCEAALRLNKTTRGFRCSLEA